MNFCLQSKARVYVSRYDNILDKKKWKCMLSKAGVYDSRFVNMLAAAGVIGDRDNRFLKTVV